MHGVLQVAAVAVQLPASDSVRLRVNVRALLLDGAAAESAHVNLDARRNAASVHLRYPTDSTVLTTGFYNEVTAVDDPVARY